jgi:hypothetical protein
MAARKLGYSLEGDAVLSDGLIARFPDQSHVAGVSGLEPPRQEGRNRIPADYATTS